MADQLCTIAQAKARLSITDATDDSLFTELVNEVSAFIQGYTGRKLVPDTGATYTFDTDAGYVLRIPRGIRAVTSLGVATLAHQPDSGGTYTTVPASDYLIRPRVQDRREGWPAFEIRLSRGTLSGTVSRFGRIDNGALITGDFGFAATPDDIQAVAIETVVAAYTVRKAPASGLAGVANVPIASYAQYFWRGSPQRIVLDRYRRAVFA